MGKVQTDADFGENFDPRFPFGHAAESTFSHDGEGDTIFSLGDVFLHDEVVFDRSIVGRVGEDFIAEDVGEGKLNDTVTFGDEGNICEEVKKCRHCGETRRGSRRSPQSA